MRIISEDLQKNDRINIRIDSKNGSVLRRAAQYEHKGVSEFVRDVALKRAEKIISEHECITLSNKDWDLFLNHISNPPEANPKLKNAIEKHKDKFTS